MASHQIKHAGCAEREYGAHLDLRHSVDEDHQQQVQVTDITRSDLIGFGDASFYS